MHDANNELFETRQLQTHLEELIRLAVETHAAFQRQQQIINVMVLLASGISAAFIDAKHSFYYSICSQSGGWGTR